MPGIGTIHGFWASSQASAIWAGVAFFSPAIAAEQIDQRLIRLAGSGVKRGRAAEVGAVERRVLVDLAGEEALAQRAEGDEADAEFLERRQHFLLRALATTASIRSGGR